MKRWLFGLLCLALGLMLAPSAQSAMISGNGLGDLLIYPVYYAAGSAKTRIVLVNTSDTNSVVAKVVIRRASDSKETLDFFVYLSPRDYFEGEIYCTAPNNCYFTSTDESWLVGSCETPTPPYPLKGGEDMGYVEVFEVFSAALGDHPDQLTICQAYNAWPGGTDTTINTLAGWADIYWPGEELGYRAVAVADYNNTGKETVQEDTQIRPEVAALFTMPNFVVPYDNTDPGHVDLVVVNSIARLVTGNRVCYKVKWFDTEENTCLPPGCPVSPCDPYHEECSCLKEVDFINLEPNCPKEAPFTKGWAIVSLGLNGECDTDAPVIPMLVRFNMGQAEIMSPAFGVAGPVPPPPPTACGDITDSAECINTAGCGWAGGSLNRCVACADATSYGEAVCNSIEGCQWVGDHCE